MSLSHPVRLLTPSRTIALHLPSIRYPYCTIKKTRPSPERKYAHTDSGCSRKYGFSHSSPQMCHVLQKRVLGPYRKAKVQFSLLVGTISLRYMLYVEVVVLHSIQCDSVCGKRRLCSECADAHSDQGLRFPHMPVRHFYPHIPPRHLFPQRSANGVIE